MQKQELLTKIQRARDAIQSACYALDETESETIVDSQSGWSVKGLIAHLTFWERATLDCLARRAAPETFKQIDRINANLLEKNRGRSWAQVRTDFEASGVSLMQEIAALTEEELRAPAPWGDGKSVCEHIADDTHVHYAEHERRLADWIELLINQRITAAGEAQ